MSQAKGFPARCAEACKDKALGANLRTAARVFKEKRIKGASEFNDFERFRDLCAGVKSRALADMPHLLKTLEENVERAGGRVYWARDAAEANLHILDIAARNNVRRVVKGKSMTSEETGLNRELERAGVKVFETDLGEYIVQLADEPPSHIIAPAVHKNRREIGDLFADKLDCERTEVPEELTRIARVALRREFLRADMGITGANMAVADTGSLVLIENEGNIRFSTTAPRIHVALVGIEKVIPSLEDASTLLAVLPRNATGLKMGSYVSVFTGPRKQDEADGAGQFHLILMDNGRTRLLGDPILREALRCLRCGACLTTCPVYGKVGGHAYGVTYPGPIGSILSPMLFPGTCDPQVPYACTQCGACAEVCPVKIDLPRLIMRIREKTARNQSSKGGPPISARAAAIYAWLGVRPGAWNAAAAALRLADPGLTRLPRVPLLGRKLAAWSRKRRLPRLERPFSSRWPEINTSLPGKDQGSPKGDGNGQERP